MTQLPQVSVVMGVYNGAEHLKATLQSVLNQTFVNFEFIIVDDGSTDQTAQILSLFASNDSRIRLIKQTNQGLTQALINGCRQSQSEYIARQDVGDISLPDRLAIQLDYMQKHPACSACFCYYQVIDEDATVISEHTPDSQHTRAALDPGDGEIATPSHHGSALFRRQQYLQAGGYRAQFYFAQDLDLWIRLAEHGDVHVIEKILYQGLISPDVISGKFRSLQKKYHPIVVNSALKRKNNQPDTIELEQAAMIRPTSNALLMGFSKSKTLYFIGSCLLPDKPEKAREYLLQAVKLNPLHLKAWYKLLLKC